MGNTGLIPTPQQIQPFCWELKNGKVIHYREPTSCQENSAIIASGKNNEGYEMHSRQGRKDALLRDDLTLSDSDSSHQSSTSDESSSSESSSQDSESSRSRSSSDEKKHSTMKSCIPLSYQWKKSNFFTNPAEPKEQRNAFVLYVADFSLREDTKLKEGLLKSAAESWKNICQKEKQKYEKKAADDKARYLKEKQNFETKRKKGLMEEIDKQTKCLQKMQKCVDGTGRILQDEFILYLCQEYDKVKRKFGRRSNLEIQVMLFRAFLEGIGKQIKQQKSGFKKKGGTLKKKKM